MLEFAEEHNIILFRLPPHTTHYFQPLDRAFFKSLKGYYYESFRNFMRGNPNRRLNRLQFGKLLGEAWGELQQHAISAFKSTGIVPFNEGAIPDYAFLAEQRNHQTISAEPVQEREEDPQIIQFEKIDDFPNLRPRCSPSLQTVSTQERDEKAEPGPSGIQCSVLTPSKTAVIEDITPGKALDEISPIPVINPAAKKARRQIIGIITTPEYIDRRKEIEKKKSRQLIRPEVLVRDDQGKFVCNLQNHQTLLKYC